MEKGAGGNKKHLPTTPNIYLKDPFNQDEPLPREKSRREGKILIL
jgi:hypothetical protein